MTRITDTLEGIVGEDISEQALASELRKSESFDQYLASLDAATTLEVLTSSSVNALAQRTLLLQEVAALEEAFQAEHSMLLHAGNVCPGVHRHARPDEIRSQGNEGRYAPLPPLQPLSAVTPEMIDLASL